MKGYKIKTVHLAAGVTMILPNQKGSPRSITGDLHGVEFERIQGSVIITDSSKNKHEFPDPKIDEIVWVPEEVKKSGAV